MKIIYNVEKFDTLESIANKFKVGISEIKELNKVNDILPKILEIPEKFSEYKVIANYKREFVYYGKKDKVKCNLNKLGLFCDSNDEVCLFKPKESSTYVVGVLDSLNSISKKFNLLKEDIIEKNNLKTEKLFIGQILKL